MNDVQSKTEEQLSLFAWREEARAVAQLDEKIATAQEALSRCDRVLRETMEWREVEALKEKVADAKREAVEGDGRVADAKDALKAARSKMKQSAADPLKAYRAAKGNVKALQAARSEAVERVVKGVAK